MEHSIENLKNRCKNYGLKTFLYSFIIAVFLFLPFVIYNNGYFLYYGDFNVQQVPFYQMVHDAILNGDTMWSTTTDLGANLIGSYSFYLISSPFFLLTLLFPSKAVPYLIAPLLCLKIAFASLGAYLFIKRYVKNKNYALLGGILYGFSGFSIYNIFFNHFHEAIVALPFLLAAIDSYMYDRKKGLVVLAVFYACSVNYYFFTGQVTFVIIYWFMKTLSRDWKINFKDFLNLAFEVIIGFCMSFVVLIPSILTVISNPRLDRPNEGWNALLYSNVQRYLHIIISFFFPPDIPARLNFTPDANTKWASVSAYIPLFGMIGTISYLQLRKRDWIKRMIFILILFAFIPVLNSSFQLFNSTYYARWFYMLTLMLALATVCSFEEEKIQWKRGFTWSFLITLGIIIAIGYTPVTTLKDGVETTSYGLEAYPERFWIYAGIALISHFAVLFLIKILKRKPQLFFKRALTFAIIAIFAMGYYIITLGETHSYDTHSYIIPYCLNNGEDIKLDDIKNVRSDFYNAMDNVGMYWQIPNIQAFQSVVPGSIMEFYPTVGVERNVHSKPDVKYYGLRGLLSCKYLFNYPDNNKSFVDKKGNTLMPGWKYLDTRNGFEIYENENFIPYGFTFDKFISEDEYKKCPQEQRHLLLLKALVLSDEDIEKYSSLIKTKSQYTDFYYTESQYYKDCKALKENSAVSFNYVNNGFKATYISKSDNDELLFFSVPYEDGWSAKVNGEDAEIIKADIGFMAVAVKGNQENTIEFSYQTPGLKLGFIITVSCAVIYILYIIIVLRRRKIDKSLKAVTCNELSEAEKVPENPLKEYIDNPLTNFEEASLEETNINTSDTENTDNKNNSKDDENDS